MTQFGFKLSQPLGLTPDGFLASISIGISLSNLRGRNCCHSAHIIIIGVSCSLRAVIRIKGFYRSCVPWGYRVGIFNYMLACMTLVGFDFDDANRPAGFSAYREFIDKLLCLSMNL